MEQQSRHIVQQVRSKLPAKLPQLDESALARLKAQALDAARQLQEQVQAVSMFVCEVPSCLVV